MSDERDHTTDPHFDDPFDTTNPEAERDILGTTDDLPTSTVETVIPVAPNYTVADTHSELIYNDEPAPLDDDDEDSPDIAIEDAIDVTADDEIVIENDTEEDPNPPTSTSIPRYVADPATMTDGIAVGDIPVSPEDVPDVLANRHLDEAPARERREFDLTRLAPTPEPVAEPVVEPVAEPVDDPFAEPIAEEPAAWTATGEDVPDQPVTDHSGTTGSFDDELSHDEVSDELSDELDSTQVHRQSLLAPRADEEAAAVPATTWIPRETPEASEDSDQLLVSESTIVPELPSRAGSRVWSTLLTLLLTPVAWYLLADSAARFTLAPNNPADTGVLNIAALVEFGGGVVIGIVILALLARSSLGAILVGIVVAALGITFLAVPGTVREILTPAQQWLSSWNDFGGNVAHHIEWTGFTGVIATVGISLLTLGIVTILARRSGRHEEEIRTQIERMAPGTLKKRGRRR